ncbi:MAG: hypothetical protein M3Q07_21100, partial [Pseudobdellovibrionaceae bacterium]|nr:hypothetical protein [Pseudobdellovibrionaceae bacterium]
MKGKMILAGLAWIYASVVFGQNPNVDAYRCGERTLADAREYIQERTGRLRIASYRGDIENMHKLAMDIEGVLDVCAGKPLPPANTLSCMNSTGAAVTPTKSKDEAKYNIGYVCDFDCHVQLSRYHLFMAGDFVYAMNKDPIEDVAYDKQIAAATRHADVCGAPIIDRGLELISTENTGGGGEGNEASVEEFIRKNFALNRLKVELLMSSGDISYQATSNMAVKRLANDVANILGKDKLMDNTLQIAYSKYKEAIWALIALQTDVPDIELFSDLTNVSVELRSQVERRLRSLEKGFLFIEIDPEAIPRKSVDELRRELDGISSRAKQLEDEIAALISAGQSDKAGEQTSIGVDEKRAVNSMTASLKAQQIAMLKEVVDGKRLEIEDKVKDLELERIGLQRTNLGISLDEAKAQSSIAAIEKQIASLGIEAALLQGEQAGAQEEISAERERIAQLDLEKQSIEFAAETLSNREKVLRLEFELRKSLHEMNAEVKQISGMENRDLIALRRQEIKEEQEKYKWLISAKLTEMNLNLQIKSLGAQLLNLAGNVDTAVAEAQSIHEQQVGSLRRQYNAYMQELGSVRQDLTGLLLRRYIESTLTRIETRNRVCQIEGQLATLGVKPGSSYS